MSMSMVGADRANGHRVGRTAAALFLIPTLLGTAAARAEKALLSPAEMTKLATHVVVGKVKAIYSYETKGAQWHTWHTVAEVVVDRVEKGKDLQPGQLVYVRYWQRAWISPERQPPGTNGHTGVAAVGKTARYYLVNKGYDGDGESTDGGFNVVFGNGCEVLVPEGDIEKGKGSVAK